MRNLVIGILLAGAAATPALAQDNGEHRWHHDQQQNGRAEGHQQREQPQPEGDRGARFNGAPSYRQQQAPQFVREQQQVNVQASEGGNRQRGNWQRGPFEGAPNAGPRGDVQQQAFDHRGPVQVDRNRYGGWTRTEVGGERDGFRQRDAYRHDEPPRHGEVVPNQMRNGWYGRNGVAPQQYREGSRDAGGAWNRDWRGDRRYDWRRYRESHRSIFHIGLYIDPFGYNYQPFTIGYRMPPVYFGERYWIDPALYSLPYPPPGTQWVRYWNDALLVDVYTGQILDVIQGFFW